MASSSIPLTSSALVVGEPQIRGSQLFLSYECAGKPLETRFTFSQDLEPLLRIYPIDRLQRLLHYIALANAVYFFNLTYFSSVQTDLALDDQERVFFEDFYFSGLAEFRLQNGIDLGMRTDVRTGRKTYPRSTKNLPQLRGGLLTNGGGKDSAIGAEIAKTFLGDLGWFTWNLKPNRRQIIRHSNITTSLSVTSHFSPSPYGNTAPYRGHKPLGGVLAFLTALGALVQKNQYIITANEHSANEATLVRDDIQVNHQYTKSLTVELALQKLITGLDLGPTYFSIIRPLYELQVLDLLRSYPQYHSVFISCNAQQEQNKWCLQCAKCAFVVLGITALSPALAATIWGDDLLLAQPALRPHLLALVAPHIDKPFECVGTLEECRLALGMISHNTSFWRRLPQDLKKALTPHLPGDYEALYADIMVNFDRPHAIPDELWPAVKQFLTKRLAK